MDAFEGHSFSKGAVIVHEGTRADAVYVVEKGSVVVFREVKGRELLIARLEKGAIFGEMALIERRKHSASVRAAEDCVCAVVTEKVFWKLLEEANPFIRALVLTLVRSLGATTSQAIGLQSMLGMGIGPSHDESGRR